jgi:hypothetical protein
MDWALAFAAVSAIATAITAFVVWRQWVAMRAAETPIVEVLSAHAGVDRLTVLLAVSNRLPMSLRVESVRVKRPRGAKVAFLPPGRPHVAPAGAIAIINAVTQPVGTAPRRDGPPPLWVEGARIDFRIAIQPRVGWRGGAIKLAVRVSASASISFRRTIDVRYVIQDWKAMQAEAIAKSAT